MRIIVIVLVLFSWISSVVNLYGQDSTLLYTSVETIEIVESAYMHSLLSDNDKSIIKSLGDVISESSGVFVKDYGLNQLQSIQFRGLPASHNSVYWNGVEVDNPFLRQIDLALVTLSNSDDVNLDASGANNFLQSGAALNVDHRFLPENNLQINASGGSFNRYSVNTSAQIKVKKSRHSGSLEWRSAKNDFQIRPLNGDSYSQNNAELIGATIRSSHEWSLNQGTLELYQFYNHVDRQIAPIIGQKDSDAEEFDRQYWMTARYRKHKERLPWELQLSVLNDVIDFNQASADIAARSQSIRVPVNFQMEHSYGDGHYSKIGWRSEYLDLQTNNFSENLRDHRHTLRLDHKWIKSKWMIGAVVEQAIHHRDQYFTNFNGILQFRPHRIISLRADVGRILTMPSYNDLFWAEGGNPDILPELSYKIQFAVQSKFNLGKQKVSLSVNPYYYDVDNWILWLPGIPFWSPVNIQEVKSEGVDFSLRMHATDRWSFDFNYAYNKVTNQKAAFLGDKSMGKQLIYSPLHSSNLSFTYKSGGWSVRPIVRYFSKLYTSRDNTRSLPAQVIGALYVQKKITDYISLALDLKNITDRDYQLIAGRAQPPTYGDLILKFNL